MITFLIPEVVYFGMKRLVFGMHEKINILMVDDQPGKLITYEVILSELGENLIKAQTSTEALEYLLKTDIAVILMDVNMPGLDGFELADMVHQHPRFRDTSIIFISAVRLSDVDRLKGYAHGGVDYISVPIVPELLRAKVRVFADLHRKNRQLEALNFEMQDLSRRILKVQDEAGRRIAREMHDGLGQELSLAKMMLEGILNAEQLSAAKAQAFEANGFVDNAIRQVRTISHLLHPPLLDELGLRVALQNYVEGLTKRSGIETSIEVTPPDFPRLLADLEIAIFRVVQEALTNVFRHSGARTAKISLTVEKTRVVVRVHDDGKGVAEQIAEFRPGSVGVGISGMRQRVREFGGELLLRNANPGTVVEAVVPIKSAMPLQDPAVSAGAA